MVAGDVLYDSGVIDPLQFLVVVDATTTIVCMCILPFCAASIDLSMCMASPVCSEGVQGRQDPRDLQINRR